MNITLRVTDESINTLLKKLSDVDLEIVEVYDEASRARPYTGVKREGDISKDTASAARAAVQNG